LPKPNVGLTQMKLSEYFAANRPTPLYQLGDRVQGKWNKIPFRGTVGVDHMISEEEGPVVKIFSDLPIAYEGKVHDIITVKYKDLSKLT